MERGNWYKIFYDDGDKIKNKLLIFLKKEGSFLIFENRIHKREEAINENRILRIEEVGDGKKIQNKISE